MKNLSFGQTKNQKTKNTNKTPTFGLNVSAGARVKCREKLEHKCREEKN